MQRIPIVVLDPAGADSTKTVPTYNPATGLVEWAEPSGGSDGQIPSGTTLPTTVVNGELFALVTPGSAGSSTWDSLVQSKPLLAWYRHGEAAGTSALIDSSGSARNGSYSGSPTLGTAGLISGSTDTAATFSGAQSGIVTNPTWLNGLSALSFVQRVKPGKATVMLLERDNELSGASRHFQVRINGTGQLELIFFESSSAIHSAAGGSVATGSAHTIGVSLGSGNVKGYVDGALVASTAFPGTLPAGARDLQIGASPSSTWMFSGVLDETVIVGGELSATEHADLHNAAVNGTSGAGATSDTVELYFGENGQWIKSTPISSSTGLLRGDWASGQTYASGEFVTYQGSLWKSTASSNTTTPGVTGASWTRTLVGMPAGGTTGQVVKKLSSSDYDAGWNDDLQGGGGGGGAGSSYPPGSADIPPASPNARDDEFDGTSTVTWTTTPVAPTATDRGVTRPGHLRIQQATEVGYVGRHQPVPTAYPYTITAKVAGTTQRANFNRGGGIILGPAAPTQTSPLVYVGPVFNNSTSSGGLAYGHIAERILTKFDGTFTSQTAPWPAGAGPYYLRVRVNSATSVDTFLSTDGWAWVPWETGFNPGFTPGVMGLAIGAITTGGHEAFFDFFRVS